MQTSRIPIRPGARAVATCLTALLLPALAGCAAAAAPAAPGATVTVAIAPATQGAQYEVQLHAVGTTGARAFRSVHTMRSGQTRTYAVPAGWLTVRIPGLCIVPTPNTGTTVVHVDSQHCTLA